MNNKFPYIAYSEQMDDYVLVARGINNIVVVYSLSGMSNYYVALKSLRKI